MKYERYINAKIFYQNEFHFGEFEVINGRFGRIFIYDEAALGNDWPLNGIDIPNVRKNTDVHPIRPDLPAADQVIDLQGATVIPGLIDIHGHGNSGHDFSTCNYDGLVEIAQYLGKNGITSFAPTSMTMPYEALEAAYANARKLFDMQLSASRWKDDSPFGDTIPSASTFRSVNNRPSGSASQRIDVFFPECTSPLAGTSRLVGINMEGPYFSYGKRGAQNPAYLKSPDYEGFCALQERCGGLIKLVDVAPELDGAMEFISQASTQCTVSVAHTEADYTKTMDAFAHGASHMTHLFNGMNGIHHRNPGPICAAYDTPNVFVELICDGVHIAPPVIRMVFELFKGRVILISDALACCGIGEGTFDLGEQTVTLRGKIATLPDGTLAGSASNLFDMLQNVISFGIPAEEAIRCATINPAKQLGLDSEIGSIEENKKADFLICSESPQGILHLKAVFINGISVFSKPL